MTLGELIKNKRMEACMSQSELALRCKVSRYQVIRWESDKAKPRPANVGLLAKSLGLQPSKIVSFIFK